MRKSSLISQVKLLHESDVFVRINISHILQLRDTNYKHSKSFRCNAIKVPVRRCPIAGKALAKVVTINEESITTCDISSTIDVDLLIERDGENLCSKTLHSGYIGK